MRWRCIAPRADRPSRRSRRPSRRWCCRPQLHTNRDRPRRQQYTDPPEGRPAPGRLAPGRLAPGRLAPGRLALCSRRVRVGCLCRTGSDRCSTGPLGWRRVGRALPSPAGWECPRRCPARWALGRADRSRSRRARLGSPRRTCTDTHSTGTPGRRSADPARRWPAKTPLAGPTPPSGQRPPPPEPTPT